MAKIGGQRSTLSGSGSTTTLSAPTQVTPTGYVMPVPTRGKVLSDLATVAKADRKGSGTREGRAKKK